MPTFALVFAAVAGIALALAGLQLLPSRPVLGAAHRPIESPSTVRPGLPERIGARLLRAFGSVLRVPHRDLRLQGVSPAAHTGRQALYALGALLFPQFLTALVVLSGARPPLAVPVVGSLAFAVLGWVAVDVEARRKATTAREEFRYAVASFLDRAALTRDADAAASDALYRTAAVGDGWALARIRTALERARLSGDSPWQALAALGEEIGVPELQLPATTFALAGEEGATVSATLKSQARSLRGAMLADAKTKANEASEKLVIPLAGLAIVFLLFVGYPAFTRVLSV